VVIGTWRGELRLAGAGSLKAKRGIVKPLLNDLRRRFEVAAAEVDGLDSHERAVIGIAVVSNESRHADSVLSSIRDWFDQEPGPWELVSDEVELIHL
jgi:hypothetical protein